MKYIDAILQSPVLHFLVLGLVAYIIYSNFKPGTRETITITSQTIDALIQQRESISQIAVDEEEKQSIINGFIEDEILIREANKSGQVESDGRLRRRILQIMRSSLTEVVTEPSVSQLQAFYNENEAKYETAISRSFVHVYYSFASEKLPPDPESYLETLEQLSEVNGIGDFFQMGNTLSKYSYRQIAQIFGKPFAEMIFSEKLNIWFGPIESFQGIHYIKVTTEHPSELPSFESMESYLRSDYLFQKMRESQENKINELRKGYKVKFEVEQNDKR